MTFVKCTHASMTGQASLSRRDRAQALSALPVLVKWRPMSKLSLDRLLQSQGFGTRKYCRALIEDGDVLVNGSLEDNYKTTFDTAGLVLFSKQVASRGAYQELFRTRQIDKTYECIAPWNPDLPWPLRRESRIAPSEHFMQQTEVDGLPNALTHINPIEVLGGLARYCMKPVTGQRHQLRVHMAALGLPMIGDGIYPTLTPEGSTDYSQPLQLLAKTIAFTDPISGHIRRFESQKQLRELAAVQSKTAT